VPTCGKKDKKSKVVQHPYKKRSKSLFFRPSGAKNLFGTNSRFARIRLKPCQFLEFDRRFIKKDKTML